MKNTHRNGEPVDALELPDVGRRILVIDDSPSIHDDMRKVLTEGINEENLELDALAASLFGRETSSMDSCVYEVDSAYQGQQGLEMVEQAIAEGRPYSIVFVDMRMPPGWDGAETLTRLWECDPQLHAVICSAYSDYSWKDYVEKFGRRDNLLILKKPFDRAEVQQMACALTQKARLNASMQQNAEKLRRANESLKSLNESLEQEVAERRRAEEEMRHMALHDLLTQLPNRGLLLEQIGHCIKTNVRDSQFKYAVMFMDLDNFKIVNDNFGHREGDQLLIDVAHRLTSCFRTMRVGNAGFEQLPFNETIGRIGGDEFIILLEDVRDMDVPVDVASRICEVMERPFKVAGQEWTVKFSIGITTSEFPYVDAIEVLRDADTALYESKAQNRGGFLQFTDEMRESTVTRLRMETDLRDALAHDEFRLVYQPIVSLGNGHLQGFEALLRWNHPKRGVVGPGLFMPTAEDSGQIVQIGEWVIDHAFGQLAQWRADSKEGNWITLSINVSPRQFKNPQRLLDTLDNSLKKYGLPADHINLEFTESVVMESREMTCRTLEQIRKMGFGVHLDDFGTGFSSLSYLHMIPMTAIKIDRSFVKMIGVDSTSVATIDAIRTIGTHRGLKIIVEGVETPDQLASVVDLGLDEAQGFLLSRPVDAMEAAVMQKGHEPWLQMNKLQSPGFDLADSA